MKATETKSRAGLIARWAAAAIAAVLITIAAKRLLKADFDEFIIWYISLLIFGLAVFPFAGRLFKRFYDMGWLFSKAVGIALCGWLMWFMSSTFLKFTRTNCIILSAIVFIVCMVLEIVLSKKGKISSMTVWYTEKKIYNAVCMELMFFALFLFWTYARGFKPEAYGTEKFMDYGFMTVMLRSDYMPPEDMWFSGAHINYYYVGQFLAAFITKFSGLTANYGYNLMLMTIAAFGFTLPFSIAGNITNTAREYYLSRKESAKKQRSFEGAIPKAAVPISGLLAGLAVCFSSNLHYPIYRWINPWLKRKLGVEDTSSYWFPDATRYIGYNPDTTDKTIHEFPSYSFILGDLHAHVINIIFVLTVLALLYALLLERKSRMNEIRTTLNVKPFNIKREIFNPYVIAISCFIGLFHMINYWDFPIYFIVAGAIILFSNAVLCGFSKLTVLLTAAHAAVVLIISEFVCLPFTINFKKISSFIALCGSKNHTPLYQLFVLWGFPVIVTAVYMFTRYLYAVKNEKIKKVSEIWKIFPYSAGVILVIHLIKDIYDVDKKYNIYFNILASVLILIYAVFLYARMYKYEEFEKADNKKNKDKDVKQNLSLKNIVFVRDTEKRWLFKVIESADVSTLFIVTIALCSMGLVLLPEIIYIVDIYSGDYKRANTMFKLTYQAFIMFGICIGFIITKFFCETKKAGKIFAGIMLLVLISVTAYSKQGFKSWFGDITDTKGYKGLDAAAFVKNESTADYYAVEWLNENVKGTPNILEAHGDSYTYYDRISVLTGLPTVVGWNTHEWLWRCENLGKNESTYPKEVEERVKDVEKIYTASDAAELKSLLKKYDIEYIYIGGCEYEKYAEGFNLELLLTMGKIVFSYSGDNSYITTYIVKVD